MKTIRLGRPRKKYTRRGRVRARSILFPSSILFKFFAMDGFINFIIKIFNQKKKLVPTLQFCKPVAGEGSCCLFVPVFVFSSVHHQCLAYYGHNKGAGQVPTGKALRARIMFAEFPPAGLPKSRHRPGVCHGVAYWQGGELSSSNQKGPP